MNHEQLEFKVELEICEGLDKAAKDELRDWLKYTLEKAFTHMSKVKVTKV